MFTDEFAQTYFNDDLVVAFIILTFPIEHFPLTIGLKCGTKSTLATDWNAYTEPYVLNYNSYSRTLSIVSKELER